MKKQFVLFVSLLLLLVSCGRTNRLSEEDYSWMPYKGNETLVFKSNKGEFDTIFFIRKDTLWGLPDPVLSTNKYEIAAIFCKHSDPNVITGKNRYLEGYFLKIKKTMTKRAELFVDLSAKDAKFYRLTPIKIDSLSKIKPLILQTFDGKYDDVYILESEDYLETFSDRSNYVIRLYWSKSNGLIRYDKNYGVYWELVN